MKQLLIIAEKYGLVMAQVGKAKDAWLTVAKKEGKPIPRPKYKPVIYKPAS